MILSASSRSGSLSSLSSRTTIRVNPKTPNAPSSAGQIRRFCYVCGTETDAGCKRCGKVYYCSLEHAVEDSARHEFECQPFIDIFNQWQGDVGVPSASKQAPRSMSTVSLSKSKTRSKSQSHSKTKTSTTSHSTTHPGDDEEVDEGMVPISTPSEFKSQPAKKPKSKSRAKGGSKRKKKRKSERIEVQALLFDADDEQPHFTDVECVVQHTPFEDSHHRVRYHHIVGEDAAFNTIPTYRGLFLLVRPSDALILEKGLETNRCIGNLIEQPNHSWKGNIVVLKELMPKSGLFTDIEEEDLDILTVYFRMDGRASLGTITRSLFLLPNITMPVPHPEPALSTTMSMPDPITMPLPTSTPILGGIPAHLHPANMDPIPLAQSFSVASLATSQSPFVHPMPAPIDVHRPANPHLQQSPPLTIDGLLFPASSPVPHLVTLPCSPLTGRPHRVDYTQILGPDPIFNRIETYAGTFLVGCRPRLGYEGEGLWNDDDSDEEQEDEDVNMCVMCQTRRQGGWKRWPKANILVIKLKGEYEVGAYGLGVQEHGTGTRLPKSATIFDAAPLVRYFELSGTVPESVLKARLSVP